MNAATGETPDPNADPAWSDAPDPGLGPSRGSDVPLEPVATAVGWWHRNRDDLLRDALVAVVAGAVLLGAAVWFDDRRETRAIAIASQQDNTAEMLENSRFVRQSVMDTNNLKPFAGLYLKGASLNGLPLGCPAGAKPRSPQDGCANFADADLQGAYLVNADLRGSYMPEANMAYAQLSDADMRDADLRGVNLHNALMTGADLRGADLRYAQLEGSPDEMGAFLPAADLRGADLRGATLSGSYLSGADLRGADLRDAELAGGVCYDKRTRWPTGFTLPSHGRCDLPLMVQPAFRS